MPPLVRPDTSDWRDSYSLPIRVDALEQAPTIARARKMSARGMRGEMSFVQITVSPFLGVSIAADLDDQRTAVVGHHESEDASAATFGSTQPLLHLGPQHGLLQQVSPASAGDHPEPAHPTDPAGVDRSCGAPQSLVGSETVQIDGGRRVLLLVE